MYVCTNMYILYVYIVYTAYMSCIKSLADDWAPLVHAAKPSMMPQGHQNESTTAEHRSFEFNVAPAKALMDIFLQKAVQSENPCNSVWLLLWQDAPVEAVAPGLGPALSDTRKP